MNLNWRDGEGKEGGGNYREGGPTDRESGPVAVVERSGFSDEEPWAWFISKFPPVTPDDRFKELAGRAATKVAAMRAAETAFPTMVGIQRIEEEADAAWQTCDDAQRKAAPSA